MNKPIYNIIKMEQKEQREEQREEQEIKCIEYHNKCLFSSYGCCWCLDKRTNLKIYIDSYGLIDPENYGSKVPRDLYYCAKCKLKTTPQVSIYTEELKKMLPCQEDWKQLKKIDEEIDNFKIPSIQQKGRDFIRNYELKLKKLTDKREEIWKNIFSRRHIKK